MSATASGGRVARAAGLALLLAGLMRAAVSAEAAPTAERAHAIGVDAYTYLYSLVTMDVTRQAAHQYAGRRAGLRRTAEHVQEHSDLSDRRHEGGGAPELRHALFERLARPDQGPGGRLGAGHQGPLLPAADARHVDRRVRLAGLADDRHGRAGVRRRPAGLVRTAAGRCHKAAGADAVRLDHRPHQDRRPGRLRRRARAPGRPQAHAAGCQRASRCRRPPSSPTPRST